MTWLMARMWVFLCFILITNSAFALERVTLQLKWFHAFQFAGYYAAKELGYYREVGLDVDIKEGHPNLDPVQSVVEGKADFGVGTSSLLLHRYAGNPVMVLACIFQHSPYVLIARQNRPTQSVHDIVDKRLMIEPQADELLVFLRMEGIPLSRLTKISHSRDPQDLVDGRVDAMSAYVTNEIYYLNRQNFPYQVYSPRAVGIDFYGDTLFTAEQIIKTKKNQAEAFTAASIRGWKYAMAHPEEIAKLIFDKYSKNHELAFYLFEAEQMKSLIQPDIIEMGYINPGRWQHISDVYAKLGMLPEDFKIKSFLYIKNHKEDLAKLYKRIAFLIASLILISIFFAYIFRVNRKLSASLRQLRDSENLMRALYESTTNAVMMSDGDVFIDCNPAALTLFGCKSKDEFLGKRPSDLSPPHQPGGSASLPLAKAHIANVIKNQTHQFEWVHKRQNDGSEFTAEIKLNAIQFNGRTLVQAIVQDITERKLTEEKIRNLAFYDQLTGLPNRRLLWDRLRLVIAATKRQAGTGAVLFMDLDNFKPLNDRYGHAMGDLLLIEAANRIKQSVRETDTVARYGGDEFVVVLGNLGKNIEEARAQVLAIAEKIRSYVAQPYSLEFQDNGASSTIEHRCSVSIGALLIDGLIDDQEKILEMADEAMYRAKNLGRNQAYLRESDNELPAIKRKLELKSN